jgi:hypothetical protein
MAADLAHGVVTCIMPPKFSKRIQQPECDSPLFVGPNSSGSVLQNITVYETTSVLIVEAPMIACVPDVLVVARCVRGTSRIAE